MPVYSIWYKYYYISLDERVVVGGGPHAVGALVLVTERPQYCKLLWDDIKERMRTPLILDGRNDLSGDELDKMGFTYLGVGR